jgi:hypothetical protein
MTTIVALWRLARQPYVGLRGIVPSVHRKGSPMAAGIKLFAVASRSSNFAME